MIDLANPKWSDGQIDKQIIKELSEAGIKVFPHVCPRNSEVPYGYIGIVGDFVLTRSWNYWLAKSLTGIPLEHAKALNDFCGKEVRVDGFAGGVSDFGDRSGNIDYYHIDTQDGLNSFAFFVRSNQHGKR
jgi:hypothetical protein